MEHSSSTTHTAPAHPTVGLYLAVFGALIVLTLTTVAVARIDLGVLNNVVALGIAGIKASLVVLFFMHVHYASRTTKVFAAAGFFWLAILITFTVSDMDVRSPAPQSKGWSAFPSTSPIEPPAGMTPHTGEAAQHEGGEQAQKEPAAHH